MKSHSIIALLVALLGAVMPVVLALLRFSPTERVQHHGPDTLEQALTLAVQLAVACICGVVSGYMMKRNTLTVAGLFKLMGPAGKRRQPA